MSNSPISVQGSKKQFFMRIFIHPSVQLSSLLLKPEYNLFFPMPETKMCTLPSSTILHNSSNLPVILVQEDQADAAVSDPHQTNP